VSSIGGEVAAPPSVAEVYSRIARGALTCWFAPKGPLKKTHIFYADLDPASRAAGAEILIHERDLTQPSPWGKRAFRIALTTVDGEVQVVVENLAMDEQLAGRMKEDALQWRDGKPGCLAGANTPAVAPSGPLPVNRWREPSPDARGGSSGPS
jgi:hypothetical protein